MTTLSNTIKITIQNNTKDAPWLRFSVFDKTDGVLIAPLGEVTIRTLKTKAVDVPRNGKSEYIITAGSFWTGRRGSTSFNAVNATAVAIRFNQKSTDKKMPWPFNRAHEQVYWFDVGVG